jgi:hypothetical protein
VQHWPEQIWLLEQQPLAVQVWPVPQAAQATPPVPQEDPDWEANAMQLPLLSQQPLGQQVLTPAEEVQIWLVGQQVLNPVHVSPLAQQVLPQAWLVGQQVVKPTHVSPLAQQKPTTEPTPKPQVWLLAQQVPLVVQDWFGPQAAHAAPLAPQVVADWEVYAMQLPLLSQQPLGQVVALQTVTQAPLWQVWPLGQAEPVAPQTQLPLLQVSAVLSQVRQTNPLVPHAARLVPGAQVPLRQQPPLQGLVALQAEVHVPLLQASSVGQSVSALQPQTPVAKQT